MAYLMVVDDDDDMANAIAMVLRDAGHEVKIELDTKSAAKSMEKKRPDLVLLDVMFPENSSGGFELAREIKHHNGKLEGIPILMLTAINIKFPLGFSERDIDDYWLPVSGFLEKPVDFDVLRNRVAAILEEEGAVAGSAKKRR